VAERRSTGRSPEFHPLTTAAPVVSLMSLNLLGKMGFGALGGFEYVAIHAGECRSPVRTIGLSVVVAAPMIALMFILGTSSVLAIDSDRSDRLLSRRFPRCWPWDSSHSASRRLIAPIMIGVLLCVRVAQASVMFTGQHADADGGRLGRPLPGWFTTLHARYRTPVNSIVFVGGATFAFSMAGLIGVGKQEAFQLLWNASAIFYALTYLVMFAIPIAGLRSARPPVWVRLAALSGFLMTLLFVALSIVPIVQVESRLAFALKLLALVGVTNAIGFAIFRRARIARLKPCATGEAVRYRNASNSASVWSGSFLRQEMAGRQRLAAHVGRVFAPDLHHVVQPAHRPVAAPQHEQRTGDLAVLRFLGVRDVDGRAGAVVLARGVNRRRILETTQVLGDCFRRHRARPADGPPEEPRLEVELRAVADERFGKRRGPGSGRTSGSTAPRTRASPSSRAAARCRARPPS
jgi:hypothetical protein